MEPQTALEIIATKPASRQAEDLAALSARPEYFQQLCLELPILFSRPKQDLPLVFTAMWVSRPARARAVFVPLTSPPPQPALTVFSPRPAGPRPCSSSTPRSF